MLYPYLFYTLFCIGFAYLNAVQIQEDKPIRHGWNAVLHLVVWVVLSGIYNWWLLLVFPFIGKTVFDIALNLWRGLWAFHYSIFSTSLLDHIEQNVFQDNRIAKAFYLVVIVGISFLIN